MSDKELRAARKAGRCADGFERGSGSVVHIVPSARPFGDYHAGAALCGTKPGRRSAGWVDLAGYFGQSGVTCVRCVSRWMRKHREEQTAPSGGTRD
jgi:hypothetical protein